VQNSVTVLQNSIFERQRQKKDVPFNALELEIIFGN